MKPWQVATGVALVAWWAAVGGELWLKCRLPQSEACVWAKAFFPRLSVPAYLVMVGVPVFLLTLWIARRLEPPGGR